MTLKGQCPKCDGEIEFEDSLHLAETPCPLCGEAITLISHFETERRKAEVLRKRQLETEEALRRLQQAETEALRKQQEEAEEAEMKAKIEEGAEAAKKIEAEQVARIKSFRFAKESAWFVLGWLSIAGGSVGLVLFLMQDVTVGSTVNLGLMHTRETGIAVCGLGILIGFVQLALALLDSLTHNQRAQAYRQFHS